MMDTIEIESLTLYPNTNEDICNSGFKNWTTAILAHSEAKKALFHIIEKKWKNYISNLTDEERSNVEIFVQCARKSEIKHFGGKRNFFCDHPVCLVLYDKLRLLYRSTEPPSGNHDTIPCLPSSDICFQYVWDLAMLFVDTEDDISRLDFVELDISYLLKIMSNCQLFAFGNSKSMYDEIYNDRDELLLSEENNVKEKRLHVICDNIINLLSKFDESRFLACEDVISSIERLKEIDLQEEYPMDVYTLLVKKYLEVKVATLEKHIAKSEGSILDEVLTKTRKLLLQVEESITEYEPDDLSELQEENNKLKERVKELENERDSLQSTVNQKEEENSWIKPLVDDHVDFKAIQFIATVAESRKEFFLLLELLPFAIKEKPEVVTQHQQQHIHEIPDPSLVTSNLQKLKSEQFWDWNWNYCDCEDHDHYYHYYYGRTWYGFKENFEDYCKHLVDCCHSIASLPMANLIIPLFKGAFKQNKQETLELLNRHMMKVMNEFICEISKVHKFLDNLESNLTGYNNCSCRSNLVRLESYLENILPGLENTCGFAYKFKKAVQKGSVEFADDDIRAFHTLKWICEKYAEGVEGIITR